MELYTRILLPKARFSFSYEDRVVMMGSCFAENIGRKLEENKFSVDINPFGSGRIEDAATPGAFHSRRFIPA